MKGYTCGQLERERHRVHFSVLLVTDPQESSKVCCQRNSSYTNGLKSITEKYNFYYHYYTLIMCDCGRVVVEHHHIMMSWFSLRAGGNVGPPYQKIPFPPLL